MKKNKKNFLPKKTTTRNNDYLNKSETHKINNKYINIYDNNPQSPIPNPQMK